MGMFSKIMKLAMPSPPKLGGKVKALQPVEKVMGNVGRASVGGKKGMAVGGKMSPGVGKRLNDNLKDL